MTKQYQNWQKKYSKSGEGDFFTRFKPQSLSGTIHDPEYSVQAQGNLRT